MSEINIKITPYTIAKSMSRDELIDFIVAIDLDIAEVDFTVKLLKKLIQELETDEPIEWIAEELGFEVKKKQ